MPHFLKVVIKDMTYPYVSALWFRGWDIFNTKHI